MATVTYQGAVRFVCGRALYRESPEPGTIVGPKATTNEPLVVLGHDEDGYTLCGYATAPDITAAQQRITDGGAPRSLAEMRLPVHTITTARPR